MLKLQNPVKAGIIVSIAQFLQGIVSFLSQVVIAASFGASAQLDAYLVAVTFPRMFGDFVVGGVLALALLPVFVEYREQKGEVEAWKVGSIIVNIAVLVLGIGMLLYLLLAPFIISILAPGFNGETYILGVKLARIVSPTLMFVGLSIILIAFAHSYQHFTVPAFARLSLPLIIITSVLVLAPKAGIYSLAGGNITGTFIQLFVIGMVLLWVKPRYFASLDLGHPGMRKIVRLALPIFIGALFTQIYPIIQKVLGSRLQEGSISALNYAQQIVSIEEAVLLTPIAIIIYPIFSQHVASGELEIFSTYLSKVMRVLFFLAMPAIAFTIILRTPLIKIFYQRGNFDALDTHLTSVALLYFSIGLFAHAANAILVRAFYSFQESIIPMKVNAFFAILCLPLSALLIRPLAHGGIALAYSLCFIANFFTLFIMLRRKLQKIPYRQFFFSFGKSAACAFISGVVVLGCLAVFEPFINDGLVFAFLMVASSLIVGIISFALTAVFMKMDEVNIIISILNHTKQKVLKRFLEVQK